MCLRVTKQSFALDPVYDESVHRYRDLELDVGCLVIALTPEEMLVTEGELEPGQDVLQSLLVLLAHTLLDGLGQVTVTVILDSRQEHLEMSSLSSVLLMSTEGYHDYTTYLHG